MWQYRPGHRRDLVDDRGAAGAGNLFTLKEEEFIGAARSFGASNARIVVRHIAPNAAGPIIVNATMGVAWAILIESGLSFLGFGIQPPTPSWGNMLTDGQDTLSLYPWLAIFPGLMIFSP